MWEQFFSTRHRIFLTLGGLTLLPVLIVTIQAALTLPNTLSWPLLSTGLFFTFLIALLSFAIAFQLERLEETSKAPKIKRVELPPKKELPPESDLEGELVRLQEEALEQKQLRIQILDELNASKQLFEEELRKKQVLIEEYQVTISDQRAIIEKKQKSLEQNESKVQDLTYEIKTLLQLAETGTAVRFSEEPKAPMPTVKGSDSASNQLKRCLDLAIKLTGVQQFTNPSSRFKDLHVDSFALDQRRLFDSLQSEHASPVLLYSQKEKKLLFANDEVRQMLGWSPEKFVQHFPDLIQEGYDEWQRKCLKLNLGEQEDTPLVMRTKSGDESLVYCRLGCIPSGTFRGHVINILYKN